MINKADFIPYPATKERFLSVCTLYVATDNNNLKKVT
jgi:hypothetical protein